MLSCPAALIQVLEMILRSASTQTLLFVQLKQRTTTTNLSLVTLNLVYREVHLDVHEFLLTGAMNLLRIRQGVFGLSLSDTQPSYNISGWYQG